MFEYKCMHVFAKTKCIFKYKLMHVYERGYSLLRWNLCPIFGKEETVVWEKVDISEKKALWTSQI